MNKSSYASLTEQQSEWVSRRNPKPSTVHWVPPYETVQQRFDSRTRVSGENRSRTCSVDRSNVSVGRGDGTGDVLPKGQECRGSRNRWPGTPIPRPVTFSPRDTAFGLGPTTGRQSRAHHVTASKARNRVRPVHQTFVRVRGHVCVLYGDAVAQPFPVGSHQHVRRQLWRKSIARASSRTRYAQKHLPWCSVPPPPRLSETSPVPRMKPCQIRASAAMGALSDK